MILGELEHVFPLLDWMYFDVDFYEVPLIVFHSSTTRFTEIIFSVLLDDDGREIRRVDLGSAEERNPGDPEEEQLRVVV